MGSYSYSPLKREEIDEVVLYDVCAKESWDFQRRVESIHDTYWPRLKESWKSGNREYWRTLFDEESFKLFEEYIRNCLDNPRENWNPFTIRKTERYIEQDRRDDVEDLAPDTGGRTSFRPIRILRGRILPVPESPPNLNDPEEFEWIARLICTLQYDRPRLPAAVLLRKNSADTGFKFLDLLTTIRNGKLAVVEFTMQEGDLSEKYQQLADYAWLVQQATGTFPETYLVRHTGSFSSTTDQQPDWLTGQYSLQEFESFLDETC